MSRSGYSDDYDDTSLNLYRGAVASATRGKRGQTMFRDLLAALDAMPVKELIADEIETPTGSVCAFGALGQARGMPDLQKLDPEDAEAVAKTFDIAECLAREVVYENDEHDVYTTIKCRACHGWGETVEHARVRRCPRCYEGWRQTLVKEVPKDRFTRIRAWVVSQIREPAAQQGPSPAELARAKA